MQATAARTHLRFQVSPHHYHCPRGISRCKPHHHGCVAVHAQDALVGEAQQLIKAGVRSGPRYLACLRKAAEALRLGRAPLAEVLAVAAHKVGWGAGWKRVAREESARDRVGMGKRGGAGMGWRKVGTWGLSQSSRTI